MLETAAPQPPSRNGCCDGCDESITGTRHKCQDCPDFHYCSRCIPEASLIHPGHSFKIVGKQKLPKADYKGAIRQAVRKACPMLREGGHVSVDTAPVESNAQKMASKGSSECRSCEPVTRFLPMIGAFLRHKSIEHITTRQVTYHWLIRISRLIEATQKGCAFCTFVLYIFFGAGEISGYYYDPKKPWYSEPKKHDKERMALVERCMKSLTKLQHDRFGFKVIPHCRRAGSTLPNFDALQIGVSDLKGREPKDLTCILNQWELNVGVYAVQGDPLAALITHRPPNPSPGSEHSLARAKAWLDTCVQNHGPSCGTQEPLALPSRVIDVSKPTLRLHEMFATETGNYVALSYCWGDAQTYICTAATLPDLLAGFSLDDLPQTLRDAVRVTRSLGLKYLWIDSLCIVQDSQADKAHEVGRMAQVYRNAYVTVGAGLAFSVHDGFLTDKADAETKLWRNLVPMKCHLPDMKAVAKAETLEDIFKTPRVAVGTLYLIMEMGCERDWYDATSSRAWCLQELVVSPRYLSYGRWPTWRCRRATHSDGSYYPEHPRTGPSTRKLASALLRSEKSRADLRTTVQLHDVWRELLHDYTRRKLSLPSDRLPAIGCIAEQISQLTGAEYVAGLWRNNLLYDAMFYTHAREWLPRPVGSRAPSWSWASVDAPIEIGRVGADALPLATVYACEATPALGHTAFGEVAGGFMEIGGPFKEVGREDAIFLFRCQDVLRLAPECNKTLWDWYSQLLQGVDDYPERIVEIEEAVEKLPERVFALLTFMNDWKIVDGNRWEVTCYSGLLLREVEGGKYERIGAFIHEVNDWLNHEQEAWEEKTITVV
ncbi:hypothetical protein RB597_007718 [Gaeumannomyces tritici]